MSKENTLHALMTAQVDVTLPFSAKEIQLIGETLQEVNGSKNYLTAINDYLVSALEFNIFNEQFSGLMNSFALTEKDVRIAWPVINYFQKRNHCRKSEDTMITLKFDDLDQPTLDRIVEILDGHGLNFWNLDRLCSFLVMQLLTGTEQQFTLPITDEYRPIFARVQNTISQYFDGQEHYFDF